MWCESRPLRSSTRRVLTFGESLGVAVDLQGVQGADLQVDVVVQELLHHRLEGQQQLFLLVQLLLAGCRELLLVVVGVDLERNVLQETVKDKQHRVRHSKVVVEAETRRDVPRPVATTLPGHEDVDKALVSVELGRDVFFDPLVDGLRRGIHFDLLQELLLQFHEREQETEALPFQDFQHLVLALINFCWGDSCLSLFSATFIWASV